MSVDTSDSVVLRLVRSLSKGVEFDLFGDMEPDIYSSNDVMKESSRIMRSLSCKLSNREQVIEDLRAQLATARADALEEAAQVVDDDRSVYWGHVMSDRGPKISGKIRALKETTPQEKK